MTIQKTIDTLVANTAEIKKAYPTVETVVHRIYDIPYSELKSFAGGRHATLHTDVTKQRAFVIHSPIVNGVMDTDIWLYSTVIKIKPAEIIEE